MNLARDKANKKKAFLEANQSLLADRQKADFQAKDLIK